MPDIFLWIKPNGFRWPVHGTDEERPVDWLVTNLHSHYKQDSVDAWFTAWREFDAAIELLHLESRTRQAFVLASAPEVENENAVLCSAVGDGGGKLAQDVRVVDPTELSKFTGYWPEDDYFHDIRCERSRESDAWIRRRWVMELGTNYHALCPRAFFLDGSAEVFPLFEDGVACLGVFLADSDQSDHRPRLFEELTGQAVIRASCNAASARRIVSRTGDVNCVDLG